MRVKKDEVSYTEVRASLAKMRKEELDKELVVGGRALIAGPMGQRQEVTIKELTETHAVVESRKGVITTIPRSRFRSST